ncbi:hypothetical protein EPN44_14425 [bacterium]|nr:MAG: hypothetical protein EPN44_14425 [bacterium]
MNRLIAIVSATLLAISLCSSSAHAQVLVSEPVLDRQAWAQYLKIAQQVQTQLKQWQLEYQNSLRFGAGGWTDLRGQLQAIEQQVNSQLSSLNGDPVGADAQVQESLLGQDLSMLKQIEAMNDGAAGSNQVRQATNYFLQALVSESLKGRKLAIDQALEQKLGEQNYATMMQHDATVNIRP